MIKEVSPYKILVAVLIGVSAFVILIEPLSVDYDKNKDRFIKILRTKGATAAIETLKSNADKYPYFTEKCHFFLHDIGNEAYSVYGSYEEGILHKDEFCNSGYTHGLVEGHFEHARDTGEDFTSLCASYNPFTIEGWECYHGMGHGYMLISGNDVLASIEACDGIDDAAAARNCTNGVFMEHFNADGINHVQMEGSGQDFFPCSLDISAAAKDECYTYVVTQYLNRNPNDYSGAITWCIDGAEEGFKKTCVFGVGSQMGRHTLDNVRKATDICNESYLVYGRDCISGMAGLYIVFFGNYDDALAKCEEMRAAEREICVNEISRHRNRAHYE